MNARERRWVWGFAAIVAVFTTLPYLYAYASAGDARVFTGFIFGVQDGNSYIAKMMLGSQGSWLFRTPYTSFPQRGVLAFLPYVLLGKLAAGKGLHEQLVALFHLFRIAAIPLAVAAIYSFTGCFIESITYRRWVTMLATLGGGLGWTLVLASTLGMQAPLPLEWYSPEWFGFLAVLGLPHLVLARSLMFLGLEAYLRFAQGSGKWWAAGLYFLTLGLVHPLGLLIVLAVVGVHQVSIYLWAIVSKRVNMVRNWFKAALVCTLPTLPVLGYFVYQFATDPFLTGWTDQNRILSPPPWHFLLAYGLLLLPAIYAAKVILRQDSLAFLLPLSWVLASPVFAYAPHNLQRRLVDGVFVAWILLAAIGLQRWSQNRQRRALRARRLLFVLMLPSTLLLWLGSFLSVRAQQLPISRPRAETQAFLWIRDHAPAHSVVLSSYETGNALPAWAPVRVVIGHGPESVNLEANLADVEAFYQQSMDAYHMQQFLGQHSIQYIFMGPLERRMGPWEPWPGSGIELRYAQDQYKIYALEGER